MALVHFTQFLRPNGRQKTISIDRPGAVAAKARDIARAGYRLEAEVLNDETTVSLTITHERDGDLAIEVVPNGEQVPIAVDRLINGFDIPAQQVAA